ncbi:glycine-rich protein 2-like [Miscanthus floridulus]|uniref:glycine-rich protein 2-like n=1 Tax=Miscanthus floridulus TaxID=154761 RepID=UPI0034581DF6
MTAAVRVPTTATAVSLSGLFPYSSPTPAALEGGFGGKGEAGQPGGGDGGRAAFGSWRQWKRTDQGGAGASRRCSRANMVMATVGGGGGGGGGGCRGRGRVSPELRGHDCGAPARPYRTVTGRWARRKTNAVAQRGRGTEGPPAVEGRGGGGCRAREKEGSED